MTTITQNSVPAENTAQQAAAPAATAVDKSAEAKAGEEKTAEVEKSKAGDDISISSRAQKLQKLAAEFFPHGPSGLKVTPDFVQRLKDYELISPKQHESLTADLKVGKTNSEQANNNDAMSQLVSLAEKTLERLEDEPKAKSLFDSLKQGIDQLKEFQSGSQKNKSPAAGLYGEKNNNNLALTANKLNQQLDKLEDGVIDSLDKRVVEQMSLMLKLSATLSSQK